MNNEHLQNLSEMESEFLQEARGNSSLSPYIASDAAGVSKGALPDKRFYIGYDIHPENLEALYFEGLKLLRWESLGAGTVEEKQEICRENFQETMSDYPLISRVSDTNEKVAFKPEEVLQLREECQRVLGATDNLKAVRAVQKFYIACNKAAEHESGLLLIPS